MKMTDLVLYAYEQGRRVLETRENNTLKEHGQFLTPPSVARYMAKQLGELLNGSCLLEPSIGSGVLVCAVIERLMAEKKPLELWVIAYETDRELCALSRKILEAAAGEAEKIGVKIHWVVYQEDFVLSCLSVEQPSLFEKKEDKQKTITHIIGNPPYFKLNADDKRVKAISGILHGHTNIYTLFMALSVRLLAPQGKACFIVPRSFCSGVYFSEFRRDLLRNVSPLGMHLFQSRSDVFKNDEVLQENVIFSFEKFSQPESTRYWAGHIRISSSSNVRDIENGLISREVSFRYFLSDRGGLLFFRLPTGLLDEQILDAVDQWDGSMEKYGLQVSTGRVVPFRAKALLEEKINGSNSAPLLWMQNIKPYKVEYPLVKFGKPQAIARHDPALLLPNSNYVLLRRFSAKEDKRRLVAAPFLGREFQFEQIGFENHLNVVFKRKDTLKEDEAIGLSALLNSSLVDRYFRILNGNTQVNAAELRILPLPPLDAICAIGRKIRQMKNQDSSRADAVVFSILWQMKLLPEDFPMIKETRITMGKIEQAQEILESFGLPPEQQNEVSALTLLVLAQLSENTGWANASEKSLRVHDILVEIHERYGRKYAENSRETIRRKVLHQFEQAGLVLRNVDDPERPTNSGLTNYTLSGMALKAIQAFDSSKWASKINEFIEAKGSLVNRYQQNREQIKVPLQVADGVEYQLSPGKHNELQSAIVHEFGPRFAPGARLIYLGDTSNKTLVFDEAAFKKLNISVSVHGKLPDVVLYDARKKWLFLVEAVTSHGPVSAKRQAELEKVLSTCNAGKIYVTAFADFATYKKYSSEIAWDTEVWIAEMPSHMIHMNGDKFLGPR